MSDKQDQQAREAWDKLCFLFWFIAPWPTIITFGQLLSDAPPPPSGYLIPWITAFIWGAAFLVVIVLPLVAFIREANETTRARNAALDREMEERIRKTSLPPHMGGSAQDGHILVMTRRETPKPQYVGVSAAPRINPKSKPTPSKREMTAWEKDLAAKGYLRGAGGTTSSTLTTAANGKMTRPK
jgi:hypothetical protein